MQGVHAFDAYIQPNNSYGEFLITGYGSEGGEVTFYSQWAEWHSGAVHFGLYSPDEEIVWSTEDLDLSDGSVLEYPNNALELSDCTFLITDRNNDRCLIIGYRDS